AQLDEAAVLYELLRGTAEQPANPGANRRALVPVLTDRNRCAGAGTHHRARQRGIRSANHVHVAGADGISIDVEGGAIRPHLGVLVSPIGVQRRLGAVVDLTSMLDIEQSAQLK